MKTETVAKRRAASQRETERVERATALFRALTPARCAGGTPWGGELGAPGPAGSKNLRGEPLFLPRSEWRVTTKPGKLYFTFFQGPRVPFEPPPMRNAVKRAYRLADGEAVEVKVTDGRPHLVIPHPIWDPMATVVVVEIEADTVVR